MSDVKTYDGNLMRLEKLLLTGASEYSIRQAHNDLLDQLRNVRALAPNWEAYPVGRDFFTQEWP